MQILALQIVLDQLILTIFCLPSMAIVPITILVTAHEITHRLVVACYNSILNLYVYTVYIKSVLANTPW